jgi:hypothetical protein
MDGMLGFKVMEHLFNDSQLEFTDQLTERGFIINRDAQYEALHSTFYCIPALMCPTYYDTYFVPMLKREKNMRDNELKETSMLARVNNELILAFIKKGYQTSSIINTYSSLYYFSPNVLYLNKQKIINKQKMDITVHKKFDKLYSLFSLFNSITLLGKFVFVSNTFINQYIKKNFFSDIQELSSQPRNILKSFYGESYQGNDKWYLNALVDNMNHLGPKLIIIHDLKTHVPYIYNKQGKKIKQNIAEPYNYPSQHYFASTIVISYIDFILNVDPEAIIILQSDHGLHNNKTRQLLISKYGKTDEDVRLMQNQTISAIRIPQRWGGLEQPIDPPNITRLLVNRFVGENYEILASENIIK